MSQSTGTRHYSIWMLPLPQMSRHSFRHLPKFRPEQCRRYFVTFAWESGNEEKCHVMSRHLPRHFEPRAQTASVGLILKKYQQPRLKKACDRRPFIIAPHPPESEFRMGGPHYVPRGLSQLYTKQFARKIPVRALFLTCRSRPLTPPFFPGTLEFFTRTCFGAAGATARNSACRV